MEMIESEPFPRLAISKRFLCPILCPSDKIYLEIYLITMHYSRFKAEL